MNDLINYFYGLLSSKIKNFAPMSVSIKGDFDKYRSTLSKMNGRLFWHENCNLDTEDGQRIYASYDKNKNICIEAFDDSKFYNHLLIYITDSENKINRNRIEFISTHIPSDTNEPTLMEESEYIYEPETGKYYIFYAKTSFVDHEMQMITHVYDKYGNEERRSMNHGTFETPKVKTKKL